MWRAVLGCACVLAALIGVVVAVPDLASGAGRGASGAPGPAAALAAPGPRTVPASVSTPGAGAASGAAAAARLVSKARTAVAGPRRDPGLPAIVHREITAGPGGPSADVVDVDLSAPGVRVGLLTAGSVAGRASVPGMADRAGAVAAVNGDFFDLGRSNAPTGPQVRDGRLLSSAVPAGRRAVPGVPGSVPDDVLAVGADGRARIDRLPLAAAVTAGGQTVPAQALNQFAVPVGGIGIVTPEWGAEDRNRTLCGSDTDRNAPCAPDRVEALVRDGVVVALRPPGAGPLAPGETVLLGRDGGAAALRAALRPGAPVRIAYRAFSASGVAPVTAVGGSPILFRGTRPGLLDDRTRAPRSAAGIADGGRRLLLVTVDGRETAQAGVTIEDLAGLLTSLGATDAVNLDGGGSSVLVHRAPGGDRVAVVNDPSEDATRLVPNALGVFQR